MEKIYPFFDAIQVDGQFTNAFFQSTEDGSYRLNICECRPVPIPVMIDAKTTKSTFVSLPHRPFPVDQG
ncbi:hypothetical protein ACTRXD_22200 [Nitrospira sp. T9]|uniref:hypothetical protein n=1 Tax=unclassified Nitrospira TaxID=2652172 RepID=UPI003F9E9CA5